MNFFVKSTSAPEPMSKNVKFLGAALAAVFVLLAVAQLYSFEEYPDVVASLGLPGGREAAGILAALIVVGEVLAIPFLLSMQLSPAMRVVSMVVGWLVIAAWFVVSIFMNMTVNAVTNTGVLGATIPVGPGWWMSCIFVGLGILAVWASWSMWPFRTNDDANGGDDE